MKIFAECLFFLDQEMEIQRILDDQDTYLDLMWICLSRLHMSCSDVTRIFNKTLEAELVPAQLPGLKAKHCTLFMDFIYDAFCKRDMAFRREILTEVASFGHYNEVREGERYIEAYRTW